MKKILFIIFVVSVFFMLPGVQASAISPQQKPQEQNTTTDQVSDDLYRQSVTDHDMLNQLNAPRIYLPIKSLKEIEALKTFSGHSDSVLSVAFSPDGKTLATGSLDKTVSLWNIAGRGGFDLDGARKAGGTDKELAEYLAEKTKYNIEGARKAGHSDTVIAEYLSKTIIWWPLMTLTGHSNGVFPVAFSPDAKTLASGSIDKSVILWDVATGSQLKTLLGHSDSVTSVAFRPDGKTLATGSADKTAKLWNIATGKPLKTFSGHSNVVFSVAFSPDGKILATGSADKTAKLWNIATGKPLKTFSGHSDDVFSVVFSPDGKTLATGSADKTAKLWNIATGKPLKTFSGHSENVISVAFSPDGKILATGSKDETAKLWDISTGKTLKTFSGHSNNVFSVAFSPDGKTLATGSADKTAKLWDISGADISGLFKKDEFESTDEYRKRVKAIDAPYSSQIILGDFDADRGRFEAVLNGNIVFIAASREEARELLAASKKGSVYINGTLKYFDKDTLELVNARLTLDSSVAKVPAYAKRPVYVPKEVTNAEEKPVENIHDIPDFKASARENDLAVVIGVEKYKDIQAKSDFSASDAGIMKDYLKALGFKERNIQFLTDSNATRSGIEKAIEGWLPNRVKKGSTIFVYYSGHGAPDVTKGDGYIVPFDGDPNYLEQTGYSLKRLMEHLAKLDAKEVIVLLDSCFSGAGGRSVIAKGARPLVMKTETLALKDNIVMLTATRAEQISMSSIEKGHGLFTYHFLKALKDGKKDMSDIYGQLKPLVEDEAKELNAEQSPVMTPAPEAVRGRFLLVK